MMTWQGSIFLTAPLAPYMGSPVMSANDPGNRCGSGWPVESIEGLDARKSLGGLALELTKTAEPERTKSE